MVLGLPQSSTSANQIRGVLSPPSTCAALHPAVPSGPARHGPGRPRAAANRQIHASGDRSGLATQSSATKTVTSDLSDRLLLFRLLHVQARSEDIPKILHVVIA